MDLKHGMTSAWDTDRQVVYAFKGDQWVGYDNPRSIKQKVRRYTHSKQGPIPKEDNRVHHLQSLFLNVINGECQLEAFQPVTTV